MGLVGGCQVIGDVKENKHVADAERKACQDSDDRRVRWFRGYCEEKLAERDQKTADEDDRKRRVAGVSAAELLHDGSDFGLSEDGNAAAQTNGKEGESSDGGTPAADLREHNGVGHDAEIQDRVYQSNVYVPKCADRLCEDHEERLTNRGVESRSEREILANCGVCPVSAVHRLQDLASLTKDCIAVRLLDGCHTSSGDKCKNDKPPIDPSPACVLEDDACKDRAYNRLDIRSALQLMMAEVDD